MTHGFSIGREWTGRPRPSYVVRQYGEWIGQADDEDGARDLIDDRGGRQPTAVHVPAEIATWLTRHPGVYVVETAMPGGKYRVAVARNDLAAALRAFDSFAVRRGARKRLRDPNGELLKRVTTRRDRPGFNHTDLLPA